MKVKNKLWKIRILINLYIINDKKNVNEVSLILMELMEFKIAVCNKLVDFSV